MAAFALVPNLALLVSIELISSLARVTPVKSQKGLLLSDGHPDPKIGPQVYLGPIKKTYSTNVGHIKTITNFLKTQFSLL